MIAYEFFLVDVKKIYFLLEFIFVGKSVQTKLGENLFPQKEKKSKKSRKKGRKKVFTNLSVVSHRSIFSRKHSWSI